LDKLTITCNGETDFRAVTLTISQVCHGQRGGNNQTDDVMNGVSPLRSVSKTGSFIGPEQGRHQVWQRLQRNNEDSHGEPIMRYKNRIALLSLAASIGLSSPVHAAEFNAVQVDKSTLVLPSSR
jgi:hypothetical protein